MSNYEYEKLFNAAISENASAADRIALLDWLDLDSRGNGWNGEFYEIENGLRIRPVWKEITEDEYELIDCEIY